jgi:predicted lipoprotein
MPNSSANTDVLFELEKHFQVQQRAASLGSLRLPDVTGVARRALSWLLLAAVVGCAPVPLPDGERRVALQGTTERVILPTHAELSERSQELSSLLDELASDFATADLSAIREAYLSTRAPLEEAQAFAFGPATELRSFKTIDLAPADTAKIDAELASDNELTPAHLRTLGSDKRGLHAIEYLLFPPDDAELEAALLADDVGGERRRQFISAAGQLVATGARELEQAWTPESGDYAGRFSRPGGADSVTSDVQAGLDTLLNESVVLSEVLANAKLGKPLGTATGGNVDPAAQESERASASVGDMLSNLRGIRNVYFGARDESQVVSLSSLVHAKSPSADANARAALANADAALRDISEPFGQALLDSPDAVTAAYDAAKALKRVLATEVLGTLGASLKFSDNDGD